jgi:hypothetical protein
MLRTVGGNDNVSAGNVAHSRTVTVSSGSNTTASSYGPFHIIRWLNSWGYDNGISAAVIVRLCLPFLPIVGDFINFIQLFTQEKIQSMWNISHPKWDLSHRSWVIKIILEDVGFATSFDDFDLEKNAPLLPISLAVNILTLTPLPSSLLTVLGLFQFFWPITTL